MKTILRALTAVLLLMSIPGEMLGQTEAVNEGVDATANVGAVDEQLSPQQTGAPITLSGVSWNWAAGTNTSMRPEDLQARAAAAEALYAATNTAPVSRDLPAVISASGNKPRMPQAQWEQTVDGQFAAAHTTFPASLAGSLKVPGCLTVGIPGTDAALRGTVLGLAYSEPGPSGRSVTIATVRDGVIGEQRGQDRVVFRDAFAGDSVKADVIFELSNYSVAQNIVIRSRMPAPEHYGLSPDAVLMVVSEFFDPPQPAEVPAPGGEPDVVLRWGSMQMVHGKAFRLGQANGEGTDVNKAWVQTSEGRWLLLESVPHARIRRALETLPLPDAADVEPDVDNGNQSDEQGNLTPARQSSLLVAGLTDWSAEDALGNEPGLVIDYDIVLTHLLNIDFGTSTAKSGPAAAGYGPSDVWNTYDNGTVTGLQWSDGLNSGASVTVQNLGGRWAFSWSNYAPSPPDGMYDGYLYTQNRQATITLQSLPAGTYNFYLYGHGPAQNASTLFKIGSTELSTSSTATDWQSTIWTNGHQYVRFSNVVVSAGVNVVITMTNGPSSYVLLNGMQVVPASLPASPPAISADQPADLTISEYSSASFTVTPSGTEPLYYQWRKDGVNIPGATGATYNKSSAVVGDSGYYSVVVSNVAGTATSRSAHLVVNPSICVNPPYGIVGWWPGDGSNTDLGRGHSLTLFSDLSYTWATVDQGFSFNGAGAHGEVAYTSDLDVGAGGAFTVEAWVNVADSNPRPIVEWATTSNIGAHFWINYPYPAGLYANIVDTGGSTHSIQAVNVVPANTVTHVAVTLSGGVAKLYVNGAKQVEDSVGNFTPKTSVNFNLGYRPLGTDWGGFCFKGTIDEPTVYNRALSDSEINAIYVKGGGGKCASRPTRSAPSVTQQPASTNINVNGTVRFSVGTSGSAPFSYQWRLNGTPLSGAVTNPLILNNVQVANSGSYSVVVANPLGSATSGNAVLNIIPYIIAQPQSVAVNVNGSATFTVNASGTPTLSYQWRFNGQNLPWATSASMTTNGVQDASGGNYSVVVTGPGGNTNSSNAILTIKPHIEEHPASQTVSSGGTATFRVIAGGSPAVTYQWKFNGVAIPGATASTFTTNNVQTSSAGNYTVDVSNAGGTLGSNPAVLTVIDASDPDYDGLPNWLEQQNGTDPNNAASVQQTRLAYWKFSDANFRGEISQVYAGQPAPNPRSSGNVTSVSSWNGNAARINSASPSVLRYKDVEADGTANINCRQGTIRFWFAPGWSSGTGPGAAGKLLTVGTGWELAVNAQGTQISLSTVTDGVRLTAPISWTANSWHQLCLVYGPSATTLYVDATVVGAGGGVLHYPDLASRTSAGLNLGGDTSGAAQAKGDFDELETFNYEQTAGQVYSAYQTDSDADDMPDWWEVKYFGNLSPTATSDSDNDGVKDVQEFNNGTNPTVPERAQSIRIFEPKSKGLIP